FVCHESDDCLDSYVCNDARQRHAFITVAPVDLDIDTDNDDGLDLPGPGGDDVEADPDRLGKIIVSNTGDDDGDGIPDFADGFDLDPSDPRDDETPGERFVPLRLSITEGSTVRFLYDASDPADVARVPDPLGLRPPRAEPGPGRLRLWRRVEGRTLDDFIPSGVDLPLASVGEIIWLEAVRESDARGDLHIDVRVPFVGRDEVRATAFAMEFVEVARDGTWTVNPQPDVSQPAPVVDLVSFEVSNVRVSDDASRLLADVSVGGRITCDATSSMSGATIEALDVRLNDRGILADGRPAFEVSSSIRIPVQVSKGSTPADVFAPFPYQGTFLADLEGIEISPGRNVVDLVATNVLGYAGSVSFGFTVRPEAPDPEFGAVDLLFDTRLVEPFEPGAGAVLLSTVHGDSTQVDLHSTTPGLWTDGAGTSVEILTDVPLDPEAPDTWSVLVTLASGRLVSSRVSLTESGAHTLVFERHLTFESFQRHDWEGYTVDLTSVDARSEITSSGPGPFHPFLVRARGPAYLLDRLGAGVIGTRTFQVTAHADGWSYLTTEESEGQPRAMLVLPWFASRVPAAGNGPDGFNDGLDEFAFGVILGLKDTGVGLVEGGEDLVDLGVHLLRYTTIPVLWRVVNGEDVILVEDRQTIHDAHEAALILADLTAQVAGDSFALIQAIVDDDYASFATLMGDYVVVFEIASDIQLFLRDELATMDDRRAGRIVGRTIGEVLIAVGSAGLANASKGATISRVLPRLRSVSYIEQNERLMALLDDGGDLAAYARRLELPAMCFVAGTPVLTLDGPRPIETVHPGDMVRSRDPRTGAAGWKRVTRTFLTHPDTLLTLHLERGESWEAITCTPEHPFHVHGQGFVEAGTLEVGDALSIVSSDGIQPVGVLPAPDGIASSPPRRDETATVRALERLERPSSTRWTTYNLEVADWHTYVVGSTGVWVHNEGKICQEVYGVYHRVRWEEGYPAREALKDALEAYDTLTADEPNHDAFVGAMQFIMKDIFDEATEYGPPDLSVTLSYSELNYMLGGRRFVNDIELHHAAPKQWSRRLLELADVPEPWDLDSMPSLPMPRLDHNFGQERSPGYVSLHDMIQRHLGNDENLFDGQEGINDILNGLQAAYEDFNRQYANEATPDYDQVWRCAETWLEQKGVQRE
ncbi:MAG: hypothetical protein KDA28_07110, partial [Phycisphaerales bacterium]|nr:hypothetical protein [Phycisphaerales bacterium]